MSLIKIKFFGAIHVQVDSQPGALAYDKVGALLAFLLIEANQAQRRETLAGLLWPEQSEKEARHSLSQALLKLRQSIDPENKVVFADRNTVGWQPKAQVECDTAAFIAHIQHCRNHHHAQLEQCKSCMGQLETAVELYRGPFLAGLSVADAPQFEQWLTLQREQYHRQVMEALAALITFYEQRGELTQAIHYTQRQLALEPWAEETHYQMMRLLLYKGQRSGAIAQYLTCVQTLADELGVKPSPKTTALFRLIQTANPYPPHNLPTATTPFVGRQMEVTQITSWLAGGKRRLITIMGPGGMGKSRLALSLAQKQLGRPTDEATEADTYAFFTHGVYWVSLAGLTSTNALIPTIAEAIGFQLESSDSEFRPRSPQQQLLDYLREKRFLLVLDNFEQLLDPKEAVASTGVIKAILQNAPSIQLLVTSRERLQLQEEQLFWINGLAYPEAGEQDLDAYAAVTLFKQTAQRLQIQIAKDHADLAVVAAICRLVMGTPLAIELAANAVTFLSLSDILASLQDSLALLETKNRQLPARHRSMEAAFNASWQRLSANGQHTFAKLSVFENGFTLAAAKAVAQATIDLLSMLINHSLLQFDPQLKRYHIHELLRQFAAEKLAQVKDDLKMIIQGEHAAYFLNFLSEQEAALKGTAQTTALKRLDVEFENIFSAWQWASIHRPELLMPAIHPLCLFYDRRGRHQEGAAACRLALESLEARELESPEARQIKGRLYAWQGHFLTVLNQWELCQHALEQSIALLEPLADQSDIAFALFQQSRFFWRFDKEKAQQLAHRSLLYSKKNDDRWSMSNNLNLLGRMARATGQFAVANDHLVESLAVRRSIEDQSGIAHTLSHLSLLMMDWGDFEQAYTYAQQSLTLFQEMNDELNIANATNSLGLIQGFFGQYADSKHYFTKSKSIFERLGMSLAATMTQVWMNFVSMMIDGNYETNIEGQKMLYDAFYRMGAKRGLAYACLGLAFGSIGAKEYDKARQFATQGMQLFSLLEQTKEVAECSGLLAIAIEGEQRVEEAKRHLDKHANFLVETRTFFPTVITMVLVVLVHLQEDKVESALELYTLIMRLPFIANSCWFNDVIGRPVEAAAQGLLPEVLAQAHDHQLDFWETAIALLQRCHPLFTII
ncbi:MAG: AAA family ATPase [Ardenticatenaceae bacterium]|nr:AAA family ATPase [Ardenticatenaceae bacterium]